nr:ABC transporter substrate-binding protein [Phytohabitans rumicis]
MRQGAGQPAGVDGQDDRHRPVRAGVRGPNDRYTFRKRTGYTWGVDGVTSDTAGLPDTVVVRVVPNETTAANLLLGGEVNAAAVAGPDRQRLERMDLLRQGGVTPVGELAFNEQPGRPAADEKVRRALAMALNADEIRTVLTDGKGTAPTSLATLAGKAGNPCLPAQAPWTPPAYDATGAAALLDEAGWVTGADGVRVKDGKRLTLTFIYETNVTSTYPAAAELVSKAWTTLGAEVKITGQQSAGLNETLFKSSSWDAGWIALRVFIPATLVPFLSGATPPKGLNYGFIDNPVYAKLVGEAPALPQPEACAKWVAAEAALVNRADVVPMADNLQPVFGKGATFDAYSDSIHPDSVRMLAE